MAENSDYILVLLQDKQMISQEQLDKGWKKVSESGGTLDILDTLKETGAISEDDLVSMLAEEFGLEMADLSHFSLKDDVAESISPEIARQYHVVPVEIRNGLLVVAIGDPMDMDTVDTLRYVLHRDIEAVIATPQQIQKVLNEYFGGLTEESEKLQKSMSVGGSAELKAQFAGSNEDDEAPIIKLVSKMIIDAYLMKASDIHVEPMEKQFVIRYRVDGVLRKMDSPPKYLQTNIITRLKIMSNMDISEKRIPLDGRIQITVKDKDLDLRVSSIPTTHGESIVMRILDKASIQLDIPQLGFYTDDQEKIDRILAMPEGVFLVTGPTGSGKTTSLYAFLNTLNTPARKIITVEDPVEYQLSGINQVQVNPLVKMTFANALRAMMRQAPNIIMVGEIRDLETADIAINASLTGHLVFSTLHTNDAPSAVTRLIDMGVKPFLVASSVRAIMAQRLVRRVCKYCAAPYTPTPEEIRIMHLSDDYIENSTLKKGRGCANCGYTGYKGRMGLYEIFLLSEEIQHLIYGKEAASVIREAARKSGMRTLREDGLRKAAAGTTTLEEVLAITIGDEN